MQQLNILDAIDRASSRRDLGMERVAAKAERQVSGWQEAALDRLRLYLIRMQDREFLAEEFVRFATERGLPPPHDARAYGSVMQAAARKRLVVKVGYRLALSSNMSPKCLWRAA